jgi:hypothetical protein
MSIEIQGTTYSGFPGRDFHDLPRLDFLGRVDWVEYRYHAFFLDSFDRLMAMEQDSYIWLCAINLLTSAIEALAHFEFDDKSGMLRFRKFVERYFGLEFRKPLHLDEPPTAQGRRAQTPADHLYKYFRSGLAHSFCIEWGGLLHRADGARDYLFETPQGQNQERALGVVPHDLVRDFRRAVEAYFMTLRGRDPGEPEALQFNSRFDSVYRNKVRPPLPSAD